MRTLIIDNYDSFTYNLMHMIAEVNGVAPTVIKNDCPSWDIAQLAHFDNVVLSPGPGHPGRRDDFGLCLEIIAHADIPVLGVCLGHQGIALHEGAVVDRAPEARHGRLSQVSHTGVDILKDIPSPFTVVRYHSLSVSELPASLEPIAYSEDGVLMALRHRTRPIWGVQFHPESISSDFGPRIMRNFAALTRQWQADGRCPAASATRCLHDQGADRSPGMPTKAKRRLTLSSRKLSLTLSTQHVFDALFRHADNAFWLDSSLTGTHSSNFSFMGDANGPYARIASANVTDGTVSVRHAAGEETVTSGFFDWIDADLAGIEVERPELPFEFALGWVGYLGYELKAECSGAAVHQSDYPDAKMIFADRALAFDHRSGDIYILALCPPDELPAASDWLDAMSLRLQQLQAMPASTTTGAAKQGLRDGLHLRHQRSEYLDLIRRGKEAIDVGETYEFCLTNIATADARIDPWQTYCQLRQNNPAPFMAYLQFDRLWILSGSPERFLRVSSDRIVESKPIKGTCPRGKDDGTDRLLRTALGNSEKDRAENLMIVDLVRNDLGMCAAIGSVAVPKLFDIESYATVHQMVSTIRAELRQDLSAIDCVRAAFPGGSMTGAPKIRTMSILDEYEAGPRGIYSGALGYFSVTGAADLSIVIRTLVVTPEQISFGVGGAVTALSDAEDEFEETAVKAASWLKLFDVEFPGRRDPLQSA